MERLDQGYLHPLVEQPKDKHIVTNSDQTQVPDETVSELEVAALIKELASQILI
jgi:hypothetical protein